MKSKRNPERIRFLLKVGKFVPQIRQKKSYFPESLKPPQMETKMSPHVEIYLASMRMNFVHELLPKFKGKEQQVISVVILQALLRGVEPIISKQTGDIVMLGRANLHRTLIANFPEKSFTETTDAVELIHAKRDGDFVFLTNIEEFIATVGPWFDDRKNR